MTRTITRRGVIKTGAVAIGFPAIVPSSVFGATAPSNRINIGAIGVGAISRAVNSGLGRSATFTRRGIVSTVLAGRLYWRG